jgi:glycosyltransferase involved in cell wall biosynthesis
MTTYALVMIVKDGMADLPRTLAAARPYISSWTICDTGSTDGTQDFVRESLADIPGTLYEDEWVNFGHNRSLAFARARSTADWLLLMDADMAVSIEDGFEPGGVDAYMIEMGNGTSFSYRLPLLVRGDLAWASFGRVHEYTYIPGSGYTTTPTDAVTIDMLAVDRSSPAKFEMHARFLEESLAEDPDNARDTYYLAQTYNSLGDPRAREMFLRRAEMGGYEAEVFYARFRAAMLAGDWPTRRDELTAAWESRPWRIEPLVALCRGYNETGQHHVAYQLSCLIPKANNDVLFVHEDCWDWGLKFERSIAAWWVGFRAEARVLCDELLANPRLPAGIRAQVETNRTFS